MASGSELIDYTRQGSFVRRYKYVICCIAYAKSVQRNLRN
jgi:hypothetical protein